MHDFDTATIRDDLQRLKTAAAEIFGSNGHHFTLNAPLVETEVLAFERQHAIRLPVDYRRFLIEVGNGGAGPVLRRPPTRCIRWSNRPGRGVGGFCWVPP